MERGYREACSVGAAHAQAGGPVNGAEELADNRVDAGNTTVGGGGNDTKPHGMGVGLCHAKTYTMAHTMEAAVGSGCGRHVRVHWVRTVQTVHRCSEGGAGRCTQLFVFVMLRFGDGLGVPGLVGT